MGRQENFLLGEDYGTILTNATISPIFGFEVLDETMSTLLEAGASELTVYDSDCRGYTLHPSQAADAVIVLCHDGIPVGLYAAMTAWIDEDHRGQGLGVEMILAASRAYGRNAFITEALDPRQGIGLSESCYEIHRKAMNVAFERQLQAIMRNPFP
jgi:GNAT superfamily N-acetyltransferase